MPMTFAREAWPFVVPFVVLAALLFLMHRPTWGIAAAVLGLGVLLFFRDPHRSFEGDPAMVLSAADGVVMKVDTLEVPAMGGVELQRIATFLSAFDVHVQRTPVAGDVVDSDFTAGRKVPAFRDDADEINESHLAVIRRTGDPAYAGDLIGIRQISGLMARRVVCYLRAGDQVSRGQHLGLIKFGSRVDLIVPSHYQVLVKKGDRLRNGESPVAKPTGSDTKSLADSTP